MGRPAKITNEIQQQTFEEDYFKDLKEKNVDLKAKGAWQKMYAYYLDLVFKIKGKKILDIGGAFGAIPSAFADYKSEVVGLDISKYAIENSPYKNVKFINAPAWDLSTLESDTIDFVHSMQTFQFIDPTKRDMVFSEINRVCKHDSLVFVILNMGIAKKGHPTDQFLSQKYEWDEIAAKYGMLDGARTYYHKLMETRVPGWEFMAVYNWPFLCYKVSKKVENVAS